VAELTATEKSSEGKTAMHYGARFLSAEMSAIQRYNERNSNYMSLRQRKGG